MAGRSRRLLSRPLGSSKRVLLKSMGFGDAELEGPVIGLANAWSSVVSGHFNLRRVAEMVRLGVVSSGGMAVEFGVPGVCDGIAENHDGAHFVLPSRELIAGSIETMVQAHGLDGVVLLGSCDKIVPGMLMAAARLNVPAIMIVGGPAEGGILFDGRPSDGTSVDEAVPRLELGQLADAEFRELEDRAMPGCGSCAFLGTANSMCCAAEALGMSLPGTATIPASDGARLWAGRLSGERIVELVNEGVTARQIINQGGIENAVRAMAAIGGSTNTVLHLLAIAHEAEVSLTMDDVERLWRTTPQVAKMNPAAPATVPDFHRAGGMPAVLREILPLLNAQQLTVTGANVGENVARATTRDEAIIRPLTDPWSRTGGLAVLRGNLAPDTAISKPAAIDPRMHVFTGCALCFDSEEQAATAILGGLVTPGTVVVIRYEGPRGGPGMPEMYAPMKYLYGSGLSLTTAIVTDGRFSGTNNGCFVGHVSPEAARGGPLAVVRDGDRITIDIPRGDLHLHVSDEDMKRRLGEWRQPEREARRGYLKMYANLVDSADKGAILRDT
jgi:dihydroxy-acid dehydratase